MFKSLRTQLLLYMLLLISTPILVLTFFGNYYYAQAIDEQANAYASQMLEQVQLNIEASVGSADQIIRYLADDPAVRRFLRLDDFYAADRIQLETETRLAMRTFVDNNKALVGGILIENAHDLYASNELYRITRYPLTDESWYAQAVAAKGERVLIPKPIGRNIRNYRYSANDIVSVARAILDDRTGAVLGVICVDMYLNVIEDRIRDLTLGKSGYVFIQDEPGRMVFAPVNPTVYRIRGAWLKDTARLHEIGGERYQLLTAHSAATGWTTVGVFLSGEVLEPVRTLRRYTLIITCSAALLAMIVALTFSASFTDPISRLRRLMAEAETGRLTVRFDAERYRGEIHQLGTSFNAMMAQIQSLLKLVYVEQQNKREADIRTLQAQIKPHFLYNTLDTIRWMAEEHGADDIVRMVGALTKLFRISLNRGREMVTLGEELEHVRCYLYIQKVRYEEKLNYAIACDEAYYPLPVNKLLLQPLVENAIYHGIKQKRGEGHIAVAVSRAGDALSLTVADDGAGMTAERIALLNEELRAGGDASLEHGYGIFNVNDRIRLTYGAQYGLTYRRNEAGGVTVEIRFPVLDQAQARLAEKGGRTRVEDTDR